MRIYSNKNENNPMINLNHALSDKGYFLEVKENYKFKKILSNLLFLH